MCEFSLVFFFSIFSYFFVALSLRLRYFFLTLPRRRAGGEGVSPKTFLVVLSCCYFAGCTGIGGHTRIHIHFRIRIGIVILCWYRPRRYGLKEHVAHGEKTRSRLNGLGERAGAESTIRHQCKNSTKAMMKKSETIYFWGANRTHRYSPEHTHTQMQRRRSIDRQTDKTRTNTTAKLQNAAAAESICVCECVCVLVGGCGWCGCGPGLLKAAAGRHKHTHTAKR